MRVNACWDRYNAWNLLDTSTVKSPNHTWRLDVFLDMFFAMRYWIVDNFIALCCVLTLTLQMNTYSRAKINNWQNRNAELRNRTLNVEFAGRHTLIVRNILSCYDTPLGGTCFPRNVFSQEIMWRSEPKIFDTEASLCNLFETLEYAREVMLLYSQTGLNVNKNRKDIWKKLNLKSK